MEVGTYASKMNTSTSMPSSYEHEEKSRTVVGLSLDHFEGDTEEFFEGDDDMRLFGNKSDNSSDNSPDNVTYYTCGWLLTIFIFVGILDNAACIYVFLRPRPSAGRRGARLVQPIYVYLLSLAAWDLVHLINSFLLYNFHVISVDLPWSKKILANPLYLHSLSYFYYATSTAHTCANWVVVALGLERYFALCHPFRHRQMVDGRRRAVYVVCFISLAGIIYSVPRLYETKVNPEEDIPITYNQFQQSVLYKTLYKVIGGMFLYSLGPFVCLLIVSVRVSAAVRQQRLFQAERTRRSARRLDSTNLVAVGNGSGVATCQNQSGRVVAVARTSDSKNDCSYSINVMLIAVMVKLLFVHSLPTALDIAEILMGDDEFAASRLINYSVDASILLVVVNSSCNFFVYYVCSRQFRDEIRRLLRRCCCLTTKVSCWSRVKRTTNGAASLNSSDSDQIVNRRDYEPIGVQSIRASHVYRKMSSFSDLFHKISMNSAELV